MKTFQDWCIDTIVQILNCKSNYQGKFADNGYTYAIKNGIIDKYSNTYYVKSKERILTSRGKEHLNLWWDSLNQNNIECLFRTVLMSQDAYDFLTELLDAELFNKDKLKKNLHFEHITPMGYTYDHIVDLYKKNNVTRVSISNCFKYSQVVLITKKESQILDHGGERFSESDLEYMKQHFKTSSKEIDESRNYVGEYPKGKGNGLLRMARLLNAVNPYNDGKKTIFVDENRNILSDAEIYRRLTQNKFEINQY